MGLHQFDLQGLVGLRGTDKEGIDLAEKRNIELAGADVLRDIEKGIRILPGREADRGGSQKSKHLGRRPRAMVQRKMPRKLLN
jgi:hypothetical protein